jgi:hypothetical protein
MNFYEGENEGENNLALILNYMMPACSNGR